MDFASVETRFIASLTSRMARGWGKNAVAGLCPERVRRDESRLYVADSPCGGGLPAYEMICMRLLHACGPSSVEIFKIYPYKTAGFAEMIGYILHFLRDLRFCAGMFYIFSAALAPWRRGVTCCPRRAPCSCGCLWRRCRRRRLWRCR